MNGPRRDFAVAGGVSAARIEEEITVTPRGGQIITRFPAQELPIANKS